MDCHIKLKYTVGLQKTQLCWPRASGGNVPVLLEKKYKTNLSKRKSVLKIVRRLHGLIKLDEQKHLDNKSEDESNQHALQQTNLLSFFKFKQT